MKNKLKSYLANKSGMTLVEVLTAGTLLMLIVFCFAPLFATYSHTVSISGDKLTKFQTKAGTMETILGLDAANVTINDNYTFSVADIPIKLSSGNVKVQLTEVSADEDSSYDSDYSAIGKIDATGVNTVDGINSYATIRSKGASATIHCFPKTLTDDFIKASIVLVGDGVRFGSNYADKIELYVTESDGSRTKITKGEDYTIYKDSSDNDEVVIITLYGGGDVCFEKSPLVIKYDKEYKVQIDAPSMIMVGEADTGNSDSYHYYVSRGELVDGSDSDGDKEHLAVIQRSMNSKDAKDGNKAVTLNSAMNDIEWVNADEGDGNNVGADGKKYGYYVMCGDNGQIRRFWQNPTTGNYYWGGDYTYYTDINLDHINTAQNYVNGTKTYGTSVSYKFISQRNMEDKQSGFNLGTKEYKMIGANTATGLIRGLTVVAATNSGDAEFFGTDGYLWYYRSKKQDSEAAGQANMPTYNQITALYDDATYNGNKVEVEDVWGYQPTKYAYSWLTSNTGSFYEVYGATDVADKDKSSYPITLTSVGAIQLTGSGTYSKLKEDGSYYFTNSGGEVTYGAYHKGDTIYENATTNLEYPTSNYTLYCGYIPAVMDIWVSVTGLTGGYGYDTAWEKTYAAAKDAGTYFSLENASKQGRAGNRLSIQGSQGYFAHWRMTLGVTPYYNSGNTLAFEKDTPGWHAWASPKRTGTFGIAWSIPYEHLVFYPFTNLEYAITGKFYDSQAFIQKSDYINALFGNSLTLADPSIMIHKSQKTRQSNVTNGEIVDVTVAYLSHPFATSVSANPTDDLVYDLSNRKDLTQVFYWNNRRETITFLDCASTMVPNGDKDTPVSLMVGYVMGGTAEYAEAGGDFNADIGSVMNNGIVFLRAGEHEIGTQNASNGQTYEYYAKDKSGYKLASEANVFHQFYYLNSRALDTEVAKYSSETWAEPSKGEHIGNLYGADYWQNNRHIQYRSISGDLPAYYYKEDGTRTDQHIVPDVRDNYAGAKYEYLRSHPLSNTKVNCVAWGATWDSNPEAMWGTENGTVLSWYVDRDATDLESASSKHNDRSVDAEFQSYMWVDNVDTDLGGLTLALQGNNAYTDTVGSAVWATQSTNQSSFSGNRSAFKAFYDKTSQLKNLYSTIGFISVLKSINDIAYDNDLWVAVGDQSDKNPAKYCGNGSQTYGDKVATAFSANPHSDGNSDSWVNVRYWVDMANTGKPGEANANYLWKAVKISKNPYYNIVQINNVNGIWVATGYVDSNKNGDYDDGEQTVICWARNPLAACDSGEDGCWSEDVVFFKGGTQNTTTGLDVLDKSQVGGINSCATRS